MITIFRLTWTELLRKKVTLMCLLMTGLFWIGYWYIAKAIVGDVHQHFLHDPSSLDAMITRFHYGSLTMTLGFFFGSLAVAFLSIFSAVGAVTGEAEHGVLQSILSRPLPRWRWYLGRWFAFVSFGVTYAALLFTSIVAIAMIHSHIRLDISSLMTGFLLFAAVVPLLVSITMLGSCWLSPLGNGIAATLLFAIGWLGSMLERLLGTALLRDESLVPLQTIAGIISVLMPADALQQRMIVELFSLAQLKGLISTTDSLGPFSLGIVPSNAFLIYTALYTLTALLLGIIAMRKKDF